MRHRKARSKLGMCSSHRQAMLRNMVTSLLEHESIVTTDARAKALRSLGDKMITLGKRGDLHARRQALAVIRSKDVAHRLFEEIAPRYLNREGGYVRVIKKGQRPGDNASMSVVELVEKNPEKAAAKTAKKEKGFTEKIVDKLRSKKG
ncbi:MAG: 50S ribosomal protein L17 [Desulfomonile tiedjei]|nr:50S ribosomal protein L17 [Desulfomonile tiedjei]